MKVGGGGGGDATKIKWDSSSGRYKGGPGNRQRDREKTWTKENVVASARRLRRGYKNSLPRTVRIEVSLGVCLKMARGNFNRGYISRSSS